MLSKEAPAHYEKLKKKGENVYIDSISYEALMMLGTQELTKRFADIEEKEQVARAREFEENELEYMDDSLESAVEMQQMRSKENWEDNLSNRVIHWEFSPEQKHELMLAIQMGVPKKEIMDYFYPHVSVEEMAAKRAKFAVA